MPMTDPFGIVLGNDGAYWTARFASGDLGRIAPDGTVTALAIGAGTGPRQIAKGPGDTLFVGLETAMKVARVTGVSAPPPPPVPAPPAPVPAPVAAPLTLGLHVTSARRIRAAVSAPATVTFRVQRRTIGRRVGATCRRATKRNHRRSRCVRYVATGPAFRATATQAGQLQVRIPRSVRLRAGQRYRVTARAQSGGQRASAVQSRVRRALIGVTRGRAAARWGGGAAASRAGAPRAPAHDPRIVRRRRTRRTPRAPGRCPRRSTRSVRCSAESSYAATIASRLASTPASSSCNESCELLDALALERVGDVVVVDAGLGERLEQPAGRPSTSARVVPLDLAVVLEGRRSSPRHRVDRVGADQLLDVERVAVGRVLGRRSTPTAPLRRGALGRQVLPARGRRRSPCSAGRRAWRWRSRACPCSSSWPPSSSRRLSASVSMRETKKLATEATLRRVAALGDAAARGRGRRTRRPRGSARARRSA